MTILTHMNMLTHIKKEKERKKTDNLLKARHLWSAKGWWWSDGQWLHSQVWTCPAWASPRSSRSGITVGNGRTDRAEVWQASEVLAHCRGFCAGSDGTLASISFWPAVVLPSVGGWRFFPLPWLISSRPVISLHICDLHCAHQVTMTKLAEYSWSPGVWRVQSAACRLFPLLCSPSSQPAVTPDAALPSPWHTQVPTFVLLLSSCSHRRNSWLVLTTSYSSSLPLGLWMQIWFIFYCGKIHVT